ncbi:MAG TPA: hypothetical protein VII99_16760 [Bacteroidia bacterium]
MRIEKKIRPDGLSFNLLFAAYYFLLAPVINNYVMFGQKNILIAVCGIVIYISEFFAFNFKTKAIRLRALSEKIRIEKETGKPMDIPSPGCVVGYGVITRMLFRIGFIMVAANSLGWDASANDNPVYMNVLLVIAVLLEVFIIGYTMATSNIFGSSATSGWKKEPEKQEENNWYTKNLPRLNMTEFRQKEFLSDVVLHLYAFMLFTAFWNPINAATMDFVQKAFSAGDGALLTLILLVFIQGVMALIALPPIRLAYWIEESVQALTRKDRWRLRGSFLLVSLMVTWPAFQEYFRLFFKT